MKVLVPTAALLLLAGAAHAQSAPQTAPSRSASDLTRDLNSGPPTIEEYLARPPATTPAAPAPAPVTSSPANVAAAPAPAVRSQPPAPTTAAPTTASPANPAPASAPPPAAVTRPPAAPPRSEPPVAAPPAAVPGPAPAAEAPPPSAPAVTVLDAAARAALPFSVELPAGFQIVTGRPGPDFRIYTIRRGERSFAMVYVGPASQFPIYSGEMIEAGGRASVVVDESGARHAVEHLFQRPDAPREIHIWTMTLDGADRALAEQIAQSVDVR